MGQDARTLTSSSLGFLIHRTTPFIKMPNWAEPLDFSQVTTHIISLDSQNNIMRHAEKMELPSFYRQEYGAQAG